MALQYDRQFEFLDPVDIETKKLIAAMIAEVYPVPLLPISGEAIEIPKQDGKPPVVFFVNRVVTSLHPENLVVRRVILERGGFPQVIDDAEIKGEVTKFVARLQKVTLTEQQQIDGLAKFVAGLMKGRRYVAEGH